LSKILRRLRGVHRSFTRSELLCEADEATHQVNRTSFTRLGNLDIEVVDAFHEVGNLIHLFVPDDFTASDG